MLVSASALQSFHLSHMASKPTSHRPLHVAGTALEEGAAKRARTMSTDAYSTSATKDAFGKYTDYLNNLAGYFCSVCECVVKDSANYLDHINGKKHQRALGMSMRVERASLQQKRKSVLKTRSGSTYATAFKDWDPDTST